MLKQFSQRSNDHPLLYTTPALIGGILFYAWGIQSLPLFGLLIMLFLAPMLLLSFSSFINSPKKIAIGWFCYLSFIAGYMSIWLQDCQQKKLFSLPLKRSIFQVIDSQLVEEKRKKRVISAKLIATQSEQGAWIESDQRIDFHTNSFPRLQVGDMIELDLSKHKSKKRPHIEYYLAKEGLREIIYQHQLNYIFLYRPKLSLSRTIKKKRDQILRKSRSLLSPQAFLLFSSLFLGNRSLAKEELKELNRSFQNWGISHYLARSGLHLVTFVFIWRFLLKIIPISLFAKELILLLLAFLYYLLSWSNISFIRAFLTLIFYQLQTFSFHQSNAFYLTLSLCFLILLYNPFQLFFLDFQLSFGLTCALALFNKLSK